VNGGEIPEIYSDLESKMGKYHRLMSYLIIFLPIMIIMVPKVADVELFGSFRHILGLFSASLLLLYSFAIVQLFRRMLTLKKREESKI
jgi:positive regulator of sigma E activity